MGKKTRYLLLLPILLSACTSMKEVDRSRYFDEMKTENVNQNQEELSLEKVLSLAKERNLMLKQKELELEIAKLDRKIAFGNFLPHISAFYSRNFWEEPLTASVEVPSSLGSALPPFLSPYIHKIPKELEGRLVDKSYNIYGIQASLPIFAPATWFLYHAREKGEDISKKILNLSEKMLMIKVIQEYYWILSLKAEEQQLKTSLAAATEFEKNMKIAWETGSILEWQYQKAKVFQKQKIFALQQNKRDMYLAKRKLLQNLNFVSDIDFEVKEPEMKIKTLETLEESVYQAVLHSDTLYLRRKAVEVQEEKIKMAFSKFLPVLGTQGLYLGQGLSFLNPAHALFGALIGSFSLFQGFQDVHQYKKERLEKQSLLYREEEEILEVMLQTTNLYLQLEKSFEEKQIADLNYGAEKGKFHQKKMEKQVGMIDEFQYLVALQEYEKAKSLQLQAKYQFLVYRETLDFMMKQGRFEEKERK